MTFQIFVHRLAREDLQEAYDRAARHAPSTADRWLDRFHRTLQTLSQNPDRCPMARESSKVNRELRELLFGRRPNVFRVIFSIRDDLVHVLRIRRAQRRFLTRGQIEDAWKD